MSECAVRGESEPLENTEIQSRFYSVAKHIHIYIYIYVARKGFTGGASSLFLSVFYFL